jgi:hypothetical protein
MPVVSLTLTDLQRRAKRSYTLAKEWIADAEEPFSTSAVEAVDKGLMSFVKQSITTPLTSLVPTVKYCKSIMGCEVELCFWKERDSRASSRGRHSERQNAHLCFAWINMVLACHEGKVPRTMKCNFLLSNDKRYFPTHPLALVGPEHCNGGVTYLGRENVEICVFRQEELFKVFVHETFHALGLHGPPVNPRTGDVHAGLDPPCEIKYIEVYAEAWARVVNAIFTSVACVPRDNPVYLLEREADHGWTQCKCVLARVSRNASLVQKDGQPTPAFEYYCMAGSVMREWRGFLGWCATHNPPCGVKAKRGSSRRSESHGIGFNLTKPKGWLAALGGFLEASLPRAAEEIEVETSAQLECSGSSARMSINSPLQCAARLGKEIET